MGGRTAREKGGNGSSLRVVVDQAASDDGADRRAKRGRGIPRRRGAARVREEGLCFFFVFKDGVDEGSLSSPPRRHQGLWFLKRGGQREGAHRPLAAGVTAAPIRRARARVSREKGGGGEGRVPGLFGRENCGWGGVGGSWAGDKKEEGPRKECERKETVWLVIKKRQARRGCAG